MQSNIIKPILVIVLSLIGYFLLMMALGLAHNFTLRTLNAVIMLGGIFWALKRVGNDENNQYDYLTGGFTGLMISLGVGILFSAFVGTYVTFDTAFMEEIQRTEPQGRFINPVGLTLLIFIEAFASGILFTYVSMQYLKSARERSTLVTAKNEIRG